MNILDIVIILLLIASAVTGFKRGVIKEIVMLVGIIIVYIISFSLKGTLGLLLCKICPFFSFNGLVSLNIIMYQLIAFIIIASVLFGIYNLVLKLTGIIQKVIDLSIILTLPSKILGLVVGFIEGYMILFMILLALQIPFHHNDLFINSKLNATIVNNSFLLSSSIGEVDDCISDIIELTAENEKGTDKNSKILNLELKYNIISEKDLEDIKKTGKLDKIKN